MSDVVLFEERPAAGGKKLAIAQLNSEKSLNSLSLPMVQLLMPKLVEWQADENVLAVFLHGAGDKAFCAGGDVVALHAGSAYYGEELPDNSCAEFFEQEYRLDYLLATYQKPLVVWGTGFVMGGGLGLLCGAKHRVVTDSTRMAMPEITIGLYPDVGGTYFLNRAPGKTGLFMGLTGVQINATDAIDVGFADHFIGAEQREAVLEALTEVKCEQGVAGVMQHFSALSEGQKPQGNLAQHADWINDVCAGDDLLAVIDRICAYQGDDKWCARAAQTLASGCPVTPYLVWQQLERGKDLSLADVFRMELTMSTNCARFGHFKEGVRALLIDKDKNPIWTPSAFADVTTEQIDAFFVEPWAEHPLADL